MYITQVILIRFQLLRDGIHNSLLNSVTHDPASVAIADSSAPVYGQHLATT